MSDSVSNSEKFEVHENVKRSIEIPKLFQIIQSKQNSEITWSFKEPADEKRDMETAAFGIRERERESESGYLAGRGTENTDVLESAGNSMVRESSRWKTSRRNDSVWNHRESKEREEEFKARVETGNGIELNLKRQEDGMEFCVETPLLYLYRQASEF